MSLLSKSQLTKLTFTLESLQQQLSQQTKNIENKIQLAMCRVDCIQEKLDNQNESNLHQGADMLIKVRQKVNSIREKNRELSQKHFRNIKTTKEELNKQLFELQSSARSTKQSRLSQYKLIEQKIDLELKRVQEQFIEETEKEIQQMNIFKDQILVEIKGCEQKILSNRKNMEDQQAKLMRKTEEIGKDLGRKIGELKDKRKNKKSNFLELLESIIVKIKDMQTTQL